MYNDEEDKLFSEEELKKFPVSKTLEVTHFFPIAEITHKPRYDIEKKKYISDTDSENQMLLKKCCFNRPEIYGAKCNTIKGEIPVDCKIAFLNSRIKLPIPQEDLRKLCFREKLEISHYNGEIGSMSLEEIDFQKCLQVGNICIDIDYCNGTLITYCETQMVCTKGQACQRLFSLSDYNLTLMEEKKIETLFKDGDRYEKSLHAVSDQVFLKLVKRFVNGGKIKAERKVLELKMNGDIVLEGVGFILMRYLVLNKFQGCLETWSFNISGQLGHCIYEVEKGNSINVNNTIQKTVFIRKTFYIENMEPEITETTFLANGKIFRHIWKNCNYFCHFDKKSEIGCIRKIDMIWDLDYEPFFIYLDYKKKRRDQMQQALIDNC